ncbi:unnamed protein product, partial [marine sediment metagenome]
QELRLPSQEITFLELRIVLYSIVRMESNYIALIMEHYIKIIARLTMLASIYIVLPCLHQKHMVALTIP